MTRSPGSAQVTVKKPDGTAETVSGGSYSAMTNGLYTFTLTFNGETVTVRPRSASWTPWPRPSPFPSCPAMRMPSR